MTNELIQLIKDINTIYEIQGYLSNIKTIEMNGLNELLDYSIKHNIINNIEDIVTLCIEFPDLKDIITKKYDEYIKANIKENNERYKYSGTYNSLKDIPGYGTEWNSRCIPDGVYIKKTNRRC